MQLESNGGEHRTCQSLKIVFKIYHGFVFIKSRSCIMYMVFYVWAMIV